MRKNTIAAAVVGLLMASGSVATMADSGPFISAGGGKFDFDNDHRNDLNVKTGWDNSAFATASFGYQFNENWLVELGGVVSNSRAVNGAYKDTYMEYEHWFVDVVYQFNRIGAMQPYLSLGTGEIEIETTQDALSLSNPLITPLLANPRAVNEIKDTETAVRFGAGLRFHLTDNFSVRTGATFIHDGHSDITDTAWGVNLLWRFGAADSTSPVTNDDVAAVEAQSNTMVSNDADNDGVSDSMDKCPGTAAGVSVDADGCPRDDDNDGVANYKDACPNTSAGVEVDSAGCAVGEKPSAAVEIPRVTILFEVDSAVITQSGVDKLQEVADYLNTNAGSTASIEGYTDNTGSKAYNQKLSQKRAQAAVDVLVDVFGVSISRLDAAGFGESNAVGDNSTQAGRSENRRVVAIVLR